MSARQRHAGARAPEADGSASAAAGAGSDAASAAAAAEAKAQAEGLSTIRSVLAAVLWLFHFGYTCTLLCRRARGEWRLAQRTGVRATARRAWRPLYARVRGRLGAEVAVATELRALDFSRLPSHLSFALDPVLLRPVGTVAAAAALVGAARKEAAPASMATTLLSTCLQLPIPEITLFDDEELLTRSWPLTGIELAKQQADAAIKVEVDVAAATEASVLILVLQGAPHPHYSSAAATEAVDSSAASVMDVRGRFVPATVLPALSVGEVLLVHRGLVCVASALQFLSGDVVDDEESVDFVVDTSRPGMVFSPPKRNSVDGAQRAAATEQRDPASLWRARVAQFVARRMRTDAQEAGLSPATSAPAAAVRLLSFLGTQHGQRAVAQAMLRGATNGTAASESGGHRMNGATSLSSTAASSSSPSSSAASTPSHDLRLYLQRSVLPLPLSEPELVLSVSPALRQGERSLHAFPPWLLRTAEMGFVSSVKELTHGPQLEQQLHMFARTVQRSGT